jgi:hypothetical protein
VNGPLDGHIAGRSREHGEDAMDNDDLKDVLPGLVEEQHEEDGAPEEAAFAALPGDEAPAVPATSRKVRKRGRRTRPRAKTIAMKRLTREEIRMGAMLFPPEDVDRPKLRSECANGPRPCPWVSCKHHLYLDVNPDTGSIKLNFPDLEVWEMKETCSLDVADRTGATLEEVGEILNLTRERIRQVEVRGLIKLKVLAPGEEDEGTSADPQLELKY